VEPSRLQAAAGSLGVGLDEVQADRLIRYVALLERWNASFNLISRQDIGRIWPRHILDSLSIAPLLVAGPTAEPSSPSSPERTAFDIGTGAGLPGLPLAIALPEVTWRLIDRNQRKIRFIETVISEIGLENVTAEAVDLAGESKLRKQRAAEAYLGAADFVVSRAVDEPAGLLPLAAPLLKPAGRLVLMTATDRREQEGEPERAADEDRSNQLRAGSGFRVAEVLELSIPGLDRIHEATIIERASKQ
jgi:16S rRNA (guanine527-N7)-methyltransferase